MMFVWLTFSIIIDLTRITAFQFDEERCGEQSTYLQHRLSCGGRNSISATECQNKGCCFDTITKLCHFPDSCRKVLTTAGGYSAMLLLPGQDPTRKESLSMLEGGNWCERNAVIGDELTSIQTTLNALHMVYAIVSHNPNKEITRAFTVAYSADGRVWRDSLDLNKSKYLEGGIRYDTSIFHARYLKIDPYWTVWNPCVRVDIVICPPALPTSLPPTEAPYETTEPPTPPPAPPDYLPDERPSAIAFGSFGLFIITALLVFFLILDIPVYKHHFSIAKRNIRSYVKYRRFLRESKKLLREEKTRKLNSNVTLYATKYKADIHNGQCQQDPEVLTKLMTETTF